MLTLRRNGRLTKDPELRNIDSGKLVTTVSVASSRRDRDADPDYVDLISWDVQAAFAAKHLVKGQAVTFSGRLEPRAWQGRDGEQRPHLSCTASSSSTAPSQAPRTPTRAPTSPPETTEGACPPVGGPPARGATWPCCRRRPGGAAWMLALAWMRVTSIAVSCCRCDLHVADRLDQRGVKADRLPRRDLGGRGG